MSPHGELSDAANGLSIARLIDGTADIGSPEAQRAAALAICGRANGAEDARMLLEACGLAPYAPGKYPVYSYGRRS